MHKRCTIMCPGIKCIRLRKKCEYTDWSESNTTASNAVFHTSVPRPHVDSRSHVKDYIAITTNQHSSAEGPSRPFPLSFFLDTDFLTPLNANALDFGSESSPIWRSALASLKHDHSEICLQYLATVHMWLPMISKKRLIRDLESLDHGSAHVDTCLPLLLLCMGLCLNRIEYRPSISSLYAVATSLCSTAETTGFVSIRLVQSLVLLAVYELSNAIYPAAYLTIGRAARLGILMGMHDRERAQQLFEDFETWTLREEQRRTWWAVFVLDRFVNIETRGMPFAAPEPCFEELLPVNDEDWDSGTIVGSEHLYSTTFSETMVLGSFATVCQSAHMLSKVAHHRAAKLTSDDAAHLLSEAHNLHTALSMLHSALDKSEINGTSFNNSQSPSRLMASALCTSSGLILYNLYGCNEPTGSTVREPLALEMQNICLRGIKDLAVSTAPKIAKIDTACPFTAPCLYHAATECAWFIREDHDPKMYEALREIVKGLQCLEIRWRLAGEYLNLLEQAGAMKLINRE
ncbi:hypothetical protein P152DRAFT_469187 [Eremomyces bilateralis CBS 781.70]|uniref:Xylanolytic transcriptional activator regulatory domain-containing protein n=1 Tax=Eremomyces bilateralis CBS 781.70 TaxID=1392243 RepID=A0A6G1FQU2_9PEZI|nr:uncharacterized protein P152DRAFT_469187 [Eremomyces bilateralis CBS 781.70]KAF1808080.1 hypothetical protein P152DRAFT_469187 [Eremomyces bilateralis CBS 781.70]